jgi:hypothetical protein
MEHIAIAQCSGTPLNSVPSRFLNTVNFNDLLKENAKVFANPISSPFVGYTDVTIPFAVMSPSSNVTTSSISHNFLTWRDAAQILSSAVEAYTD